MLGLKFIKFKPSDYVVRYKKGKVFKEGTGMSFFYITSTTSIVSIPTTSSDVPFMFLEETNDYQTITVQGEMTYCINDYKKILQNLDFTYDVKLKQCIKDNDKIISQRLVNVARVCIKKHVQNMLIREAIKSTENLSRKIIKEMRENEEVQLLGIEIMGFSILALSPNKETSRALEAETREDILKRADEALYQRRHASIDQERKIKENELKTEIMIESQSKHIKEIQLETKRLIMEKKNSIKNEELGYAIQLEEKRKSYIEISILNQKAQTDAKAYELSCIMKSFSGVEPTVIHALANMGLSSDKLIAMAFQEIANKADKIGQLNITPDLLQNLLSSEMSNDSKR